jgi:hypothetical protein
MGKKILVVCMVVLVSLCVVSSVLAEVKIHGFLLARTLATNNNYTERIDRYGLNLTNKVDDEFDWVTEIYIHPTEADARARLYMESAYLNWHLDKKLPWDFTVRIGKGRNYCYGITPAYSSRRTSDYSLYSEAFTQEKVLGFQTFSNFGKLQLALALVNPYTLASRPVPDFPLGKSLNIPICDRDTDQSKIQRVAVSGRLGYKMSVLNMGASFYVSETGPQDDNELNRYGLDGEMKLDNGLLAQGQFTIAKTNGEDHNGGEFLLGYEKDKVGLYARYGLLTYDKGIGYDGSDRYDLNQVMLSAVYKIRPTIHFRLEGLINGEDSDKKIDNDVLFFETLFAW